MKIWQNIIIILLIASLPLLASCDILGIGSKSKEAKYYEQQIQIMQQQQEASAKAQQEYYDALQKSLQDYMNQYSAYSQSQKEAEIKAIQDAAAAQATEIPYN
jgi:hypothetical protein